MTDRGVHTHCWHAMCQYELTFFERWRDSPKTAQASHKRAPNNPETAQENAKRAQDRPKTTPRQPQDSPRQPRQPKRAPGLKIELPCESGARCSSSLPIQCHSQQQSTSVNIPVNIQSTSQSTSHEIIKKHMKKNYYFDSRECCSSPK